MMDQERGGAGPIRSVKHDGKTGKCLITFRLRNSNIARKRRKMVAWCKVCGAFIGLREPLSDWSTDRGGICAVCAEKETPKPANEDDPPQKDESQS
jgi:hypothetical protein